jgi:hypothetical protein
MGDTKTNPGRQAGTHAQTDTGRHKHNPIYFIVNSTSNPCKTGRQTDRQADRAQVFTANRNTSIYSKQKYTKTRTHNIPHETKAQEQL